MKISLKINIILATIFIVLILIGFVVDSVYSRSLLRDKVEALARYNIQKSRIDASEIISNIVLKQDRAIDLYLQMLAERDRLEQAEIVYDDLGEENSKSNLCFHSAALADEVCVYSDGGGRYSLYYPLQYGNQKFGFLKKTFAVSKGVVLFKNDASNFILLLAILLLSNFIGSSLSLNKVVSKPLKQICRSIQPLRYGQFELDIPKQDTDELRYLTDNIKSVAGELSEYQRIVARNANLAAVGRMSSHIAHDMRSPMSVLSAYVNMRDELNDADAQELKGAAERSVAKLARMADELVDYAKADRVAKSECNLRDLCGTVIEETADEARKVGVSIGCECGKGVIANLDSYRIERALVNLVKNAIQASRGAAGKVILDAAVGERGELIVRVQDDGKGIPADDLPQIFDSFFTKGKKGGTGLGLAYCKQVVEAHGGTIGVESEVGKGTTFTIRIPDCVVEEGAREERDPDQPKRYLIADDDELMRLHWQHIVKQRGGTVVYTAASTGEILGNSGIDYSSIDAAVVDYEFKGEKYTGIDLITYLKHKGVRHVHLCTGYSDNQNIVDQAKQAGADTVIPKPIDERTFTV